MSPALVDRFFTISVTWEAQNWILKGFKYNLPATQETPVQFLGWEDLLEKRSITHSSILGLPQWLSW